MSYNYEDILIIGDSFCGDRNSPDHWPYILLEKLTGRNDKIVRGMGFPGASWWSTRKELIRQFHEHELPKILILTHTEPSRIPSDEDLPLNTSTILNNQTSTIDKEVRITAKNYYQHLYSSEFSEWAVLRWFEELDNILDKHRISITIHLYSFDTTNWTKSKVRYTFKNGVTSNEVLYNLQTSDCLFSSPNHFSIEKNKILAQSLFKIITSFDVSMNSKCINFNLLEQ